MQIWDAVCSPPIVMGSYVRGFTWHVIGLYYVLGHYMDGGRRVGCRTGTELGKGGVVFTK